MVEIFFLFRNLSDKVYGRYNKDFTFSVNNHLKVNTVRLEFFSRM